MFFAPDEVSVTSHSMDRGDPSAAGSAAWMSSAANRPPLAPALPCASNGVITKFAGAPAFTFSPRVTSNLSGSPNYANAPSISSNVHFTSFGSVDDTLHAPVPKSYKPISKCMLLQKWQLDFLDSLSLSFLGVRRWINRVQDKYG